MQHSSKAFQPKAVLFDLDGTLLDTARDLGNALNYVLDQYGLPQCEYSTYRNHASHGALGLLRLGFGDKLADYDLQELRQMFLTHYNDNICQDTDVFAGIDELLGTLDNQNVPWGIVTNKPGWLTDALLPNFDQFKHCQVVVSGDTLPQRKPDPAPLLFAADKLSQSPDLIWYVGDAERDIQAANSANMFSVVAEYGYIAEHEQPHTWQADLHVNNVDALTKQVSNL